MCTLGDEMHALARSEEMVRATRELFASLSAQRAELPKASARWRPVLRADRLVGLWTIDAEMGASSFFVRPAERGQGVGDDVVEQLAERGHDLLLPARSQALGYFEERGYLALSVEGAALRLRAPTRVENRRAAASVCLFETGAGQVLIGQRLTPPWPGYWAFPGGKLDAQEPALLGGLRELREETGIAIQNPEVLRQTRVYAGGAGTIYAIDNFCVRVRELYEPDLRLPELRPYWVALDRVAELRPMAAGTRRVIRKIRRMALAEPGLSL
jgi:8-oxo-dGTP pyrophosphatase MutT (NUDIX family)